MFGTIFHLSSRKIKLLILFQWESKIVFPPNTLKYVSAKTLYCYPFILNFLAFMSIENAIVSILCCNWTEITQIPEKNILWTSDIHAEYLSCFISERWCLSNQVNIDLSTESFVLFRVFIDCLDDQISVIIFCFPSASDCPRTCKFECLATHLSHCCAYRCSCLPNSACPFVCVQCFYLHIYLPVQKSALVHLCLFLSLFSCPHCDVLCLSCQWSLPWQFTPTYMHARTHTHTHTHPHTLFR